MERWIRTSWVLAFLVLTLAGGTVSAREPVLSDESRHCLQCHGRKGIVKRFLNGETIEAYVNPERIRTSAHNILACTECHTGFSASAHPAGKYRNKAQFQARMGSLCRRCHKADTIRAKSIHATLFSREKEGDSPVCTHCHDAHSVSPAPGGRISAGETEYCMGCHRFEIFMACTGGERISLKVDLPGLEASAHGKLRCSDCHYGYSSEEHPQKTFRGRRDFVIALAESCRRCHFDNYTRTLDSVHYDILSQGNLQAPVCSDCHGSHLIAHISQGVRGRAATTQRCQRCHPAIYETYAKSIHGSALINEQNQDVPICIDCHTAHDIENPLTLEYHERIPQMCGNCHARPEIMGKYGLSTDVVKTYLADFHGVTLGFYKKQREELYKPARPIAVCNDCHGTHDIASTISSDPAVVKKNLVRQCRKCHEDASENFPDAWLFHYKPTLKRFPVIFLVDTAYRILVPIMWLGLILQVLLHIWRYAVNR